MPQAKKKRCKDCKKPYKLQLEPDPIIYQTMEHNGHGFDPTVLCGPCILTRIERDKYWPYDDWRLTRNFY